MCCVRQMAAHVFVLLCETPTPVKYSWILYFALSVFVFFIMPCLILCLIFRVIHLGKYFHTPYLFDKTFWANLFFEKFFFTKKIMQFVTFLGLFSIFYFVLRPLSSVEDNLARDEKLNELIVRVSYIFYKKYKKIFKICLFMFFLN